VSSTLLEICPEDPTDIVLFSKWSKNVWPSWATSNCLSPDDIPVELASLSSDEVRVIPSIARALWADKLTQ